MVMISLSMDIFHALDEFKRENNLIVDSILFFHSSAIKKLLNANNPQKKTLEPKCRKMSFQDTESRLRSDKGTVSRSIRSSVGNGGS